MAERGKKEKQKRSSDMSSEEIEKYFKDKDIDINEEILKLRRIVLLNKRIFDDEKKNRKRTKDKTEKPKFPETDKLKNEKEKRDEKESDNKIGDTIDEYRMACNGMYGEDGLKIE
jgi:hypothetical protein